MLHLTYPDIARLITLAEQDYCLPHLPSDLNSSGWAMILLFIQIQKQYVAFVVFLFCDFVCFFFSDLFFALIFGSFFLHNFSLVRWPHSSTLKYLPSSRFFFPDTPFLPLWRGRFFSPEGVGTP